MTEHNRPDREVEARASILDPLVVDYGRVSRKAARNLKAGRGELLGEVQDIVAELLEDLDQEADGRRILPVVFVCRYKRKKRRERGWFFPFPFG